jgi:hypothetical protein
MTEKTKANKNRMVRRVALYNEKEKTALKKRAVFFIVRILRELG